MIGAILGWKFNHAPGIETRDGVITAWPESLGPVPTPEQIDAWTSEYEAAVAAPATVTRTQALLALLEVGITEAMILAKIEEMSDATERERSRIRFNAPEWRRDSELLAVMAAAFGLSPAAVDGRFIAAAGF